MASQKVIIAFASIMLYKQLNNVAPANTIKYSKYILKVRV